MADGQYIEEWKAITSLLGYEVSNQGRVRSKWLRKKRTKIESNTWSILHQNISPCGYRRVWIDGALYFVHVLLLEAFRGPKPEKSDARHLDDNKSNNTLDNLCWGTRSENLKDAIRNGCHLIGSDMPNAKLTEEAVVNIRRAYKVGTSQISLARYYGVHQSIISEICAGKRWTHVPME